MNDATVCLVWRNRPRARSQILKPQCVEQHCVKKHKFPGVFLERSWRALAALLRVFARRLRGLLGFAVGFGVGVAFAL
jgi:hypothetical protein